MIPCTISQCHFRLDFGYCNFNVKIIILKSRDHYYDNIKLFGGFSERKTLLLRFGEPLFRFEVGYNSHTCCFHY